MHMGAMEAMAAEATIIKKLLVFFFFSGCVYADTAREPTIFYYNGQYYYDDTYYYGPGWYYGKWYGSKDAYWIWRRRHPHWWERYQKGQKVNH